ncbi:MAG: leucine-rich repeat domain-containing protein [Prevotella sp.]|nr:leucine-rich repeat domain-containing protein [Prevotella sp.]
MKKSLLSFVLALLPIVASADPVKIGDLWYNLIPKSGVAEVAPDPNLGYTGDITIPSSVPYNGINYTVTKIEDNAFDNSQITSVTIRNGVVSIGYSAFSHCNNLTSVVIPQSMTSIGNMAFMDCMGLTSVHITDLAAWCAISFADMDANPLYNAHHLYVNGNIVQNLVIPNGVTTIGDWAFNSCSDLSSVIIPSGVTIIGNYAFSNCANLSSVTIGDDVVSIGMYAFSSTSLASVTFGSSVATIGTGAFWGCSGLNSVVFPSSLTTIDSNAFDGCCGLSTLEIPNSVSNINSGAFDGCSGLASVTIGSGVNYIGNYAFKNCTQLADVYCKATQLRTALTSDGMYTSLYTEPDAFTDSYQQDITLYVPAASITAYQAIEPWKYFKGPLALTGGTTKCAKPTISYTNGTIDFTCSTAGVEFVSSVTSEDVKNYSTASITLTQKFTISVYATKAGMDNSDTATMDIIITGNGQAIVVGDMDGNGTLDAVDIVKLVDKIMGR